MCLYQVSIAGEIEYKQLEILPEGHKQLEFFILDTLQKQVNDIRIEDFKVLENGVEIEELSIECSENKMTSNLSSYLMIDNSGSMAGSGIDIALSAANEWVSSLNNYEGEYECGVGAFNTYADHRLDLTSNSYYLKYAINTITPGGGTDFNEAYLGLNGAINNIKDGRFNKVLVFLTDGFSFVDYERVVRVANQNNIKIYNIVINSPVPKALYDISKSTGGISFGNVTNEQQAIEIYKNIFARSIRSVSYCKLKWSSYNFCKGTEIFYKNKALTLDYSPKAKLIRPYLDAKTKEIDLGVFEQEIVLDTILKFIAINGINIIESINYDSTYIRIEKKLDTPILINEGDSIEIPIRIYKTPKLIHTVMNITTNCDEYQIMIIGDKNDPILPPQKRYGFGTTAILANIGSTQFPNYSGFNSGFGLQFYISKTLALKLSYGFIEIGSKPNIDDIINNINLKRAAGAHLRINFNENENIIFFVAPGLIYRDNTARPEFNDGWSRIHGDYSITANLLIGVEWFFEHNLGLSFQYDINYTRYFNQEGIIKEESKVNDSLFGSKLSISPIPTITISYYIN